MTPPEFSISITVLTENAIRIRCILAERSGDHRVDEIPSETSQLLANLARRLEIELGDACLDAVSAFTDLVIYFDLRLVDAEKVKNRIEGLCKTLSQDSSTSTTRIAPRILPFCADERFAFDLDTLCKKKQLNKSSFLDEFTKQTFDVHAVGFAPGFSYLGFVPPKLAHPRRAEARARVDAGSIGIADRQTGIYPSALPGGWNIIGRCPLDLLKKDIHEPLAVGDRVQFILIDLDKYNELNEHEGR